MKEGIGRPSAHDAHEVMGTKEAREAPPKATADEECELCGMRMYGLHCKLVCPNCGYRRDCSDP